MTISDLYDSMLDNNIDMKLVGEVSCDDETIKWEYDGLGKLVDDMETHLTSIYETDKETISDFFSEKNIEDSFFISELNIDESFITFEITEV